MHSSSVNVRLVLQHYRIVFFVAMALMGIVPLTLLSQIFSLREMMSFICTSSLHASRVRIR